MNELLRRMLFLPPQSSSVALKIDQLHYAVILTTLLGSLLVGLAAAYFLLRYHHRAAPADVPASAMAGSGLPRSVELGAAAFLLAVFVGFWVVGFRQLVELETPPPNALPIQAVAKQWMWSFAYPNGRGSKGVLYVPAGHPVRLSMISRDVIHSFFVPEFRVKKDVVPGRVTELWFEALAPGNYAAYCTEYCGEGHSTMRAQVVALSDAEYGLALERLPPLELDVAGPVYREPAVAGLAPREQLSLAAMGERVATERGCMRCHTPDGSPHIGPSWVGMYGSLVTLADGQQLLADAAYLTESMMDPRARLRQGFQPVMPSYQGLLSAPEVGALLEYLRTLAYRPSALPPAPLSPAGSPGIQLPSAADTRGSSYQEEAP